MSVDSFEEPDGPEHMLNWILGGIIIFLIIVIVGFIVKVRTLYAGTHHISIQILDLDVKTQLKLTASNILSRLQTERLYNITR